MRDQVLTRGRNGFAAAVAAVGLFAAIAPAAHAEIIYLSIRETSAMDPQDKLLKFDSATPGTLTDLGFVTNLGSLQYLEDIDFRPATGELYGLGYTGSVYKINLNTLVATSQGFATAPGSGYSGGGIDFNPVTDKLKLVDGPNQWNATFNPATNTGTLNSMSLDYAPGDPNLAGAKKVNGLAYSNNLAGALNTTLYGIDLRDSVASGVLTTINPEAAGTLHTVGNLGVAAGDVGGFDISGTTGTAYLVLNNFILGPNDYVSTLYTVNLATGAATPLGVVGIDGTTYKVTGLSVAPDAAPAPLPAAALAGPALAGLAGIAARRWRRRA